MTQTRFYSSVAPQTSLAAGIGPSDATCQLLSTTGLPGSFPFTLAIDYGAATEELVDVTNLSGLTATITRAVDGTSAAAHASGAFVRHVSSARDFTAANIHESSTSGVHGVVGNVVGDSDTQTLSNKTLTAAIMNSPTINGAAVSGTFTGSPTFSGTLTAKSSGAAVIPFVVDTVSGQTADLVNWRVNGTTISKVDVNGILRGPGAVLTGTNPAVNTLAVTGAAAQSAYILAVSNTVGSPIFSVDPNGNAQVLPTGTGSGNTYLQVSGPNSGSTGAKILQLTPSVGGPAFTVTNDNPLLATAPTVQSTALSVTNGSANTTGLIVNSTSTAALLADMQKSGVSKFNVDQNGNALAQGDVQAVGNVYGANVTNAAHTYTPTISGGALTLGNGTITGRWVLSGSAYIIQIHIAFGSTSSLAATGGLTFSLPAGVQGGVNDAVGTGYFTKTSGGAFNLAACTVSAGTGALGYFIPRQSDLTFQSFNTTNGAAVATGSTLNLCINILP